MDKKEIRKAVFNKYIVPTINKKGYSIGVELEMPIINLDKKAVDFSVVHKVTQGFIKELGFKAEKIDDEGNVYLAAEETTGDTLSYDYSYNNLEFSMGRENDLNNIYERFKKYYSFATSILREYNHTITGMGVNPYYMYNDNNALPGERYRMIQNHLESYTEYNRFESFHTHPEFGAYSCASQVQLDVCRDQILNVINTFSKLEPVKALLFSNSLFEIDDWKLLCARDRFWESSMYGYNKHNIGTFDIHLDSEDELVNYILGTSIFNTERNGKYIHFQPMPISEYLSTDEINGKVYKDGDFVDIKLKPIEEDLLYLRSYKFTDLTYRGTIEFRSACCQPMSDCMTVAAFHVGALENIEKIKEILDSDKVIFSRGYSTTELRKMLINVEYPKFVDVNKLKELLVNILNCINDGLALRGKGEEKFLKELYNRADKLESPARKMYNGLKSGESVENYIKKYGVL